MEEYEKRRERLRAMRAEANEADTSSTSPTPSMLANPLVETPEAPLLDNPRFDYYTDPMAAFFATKRRNNNVASDQSSSSGILPPPPVNIGLPPSRFPSPLPGNRIAETTTPQGHQYLGNYPPDQRGYGHNPIPYRSPMGMSRPYNAHHGNPNYSTGPRPYVAANYNYNYNPHSPQPRPGQTGGPFNAGQVRGHWVQRNPSSGPSHGDCSSPNWGRGGGRYQGSSASPGQGRRGGQGMGFGGRSSGPERFYNDSMTEDPWKFLEPVVWVEIKSSGSGPDFSKTWTQDSIGTKKARVSDASNKSESQPSLAEYLAASLSEAVDDAPNT